MDKYIALEVIDVMKDDKSVSHDNQGAVSIISPSALLDGTICTVQ